MAKAGIFLLAGTRYGFMSDELYFLDAAARPALGYVDLPPFLPWLLGLLGSVGLDSLFVLRAFAAAVGVLVVCVSVDLCRVLGGRIWACWLVALVFLFAPGFLSVQSILTMNVLDQFWWAAALWLAARHLQTRRPVFMLLLGLVLGLGVLTKLSILALCAALPLAWLFWDRKIFQAASTWLAVLVACSLIAPFVAWQLANDWPFLEFVAAYNSVPPNALVLRNPALGLVLTMNPGYVVIWGVGAVYVFLSPDRVLKVLGTAVWLCLALYAWAGVKFYFAVPALGFFSIAGVLFWQQQLAAGPPVWRVALMGLAASGVLAIPGASPVLPEARLQQLTRFLRDSEQAYPGREPADLERYFPHFAEMHGWPELVDLVAYEWEQLPSARRKGAVLMASHYGQAGALNQLDYMQRLPQAHGRHMSYHLWSEGLGYQQGLFVGFEATELLPLFATVEELAQFDCQGCMARERGLRLFYVSNPRLPANQLRDRLRRYDFF
ncbi:MAG: glycosyltransferase family 39 protein [Gammaproteobacteria bacterium]